MVSALAATIHIHMACNGYTLVRSQILYLHGLLDADYLPGGGMPMSTNRTKWPVTGGAVGVQPGWFQGHSNALIYINLGDGTVPENYSLIMQPVFGIVGPDNVAYNGSFCLPQVPLPANYTAVIGNNATIQVIEAAQHGAALFNVSCF